MSITLSNTFGSEASTASQLVPVATALGGVVLGAFLAGVRNWMTRRHRFKERQLAELYSPLLGLREAIRVTSEFRHAVGKISKGILQKQLAAARKREDPAVLEQQLEYQTASIKKSIDYDNHQLREQLLPWYEEMLRVYREKMWLARPETRQQFEELVRFVDLWKRFLASAIEPGVLDEIEHGEERLKPLYDHIEEVHGNLVKDVARGRNT